MKLGKTPAFELPVTTKPNKQWQQLNLYGCFIQMASDLGRQRVLAQKNHLAFSFQARLFITVNRQGVVRGFEFQGRLVDRNCSIPVLGS